MRKIKYGLIGLFAVTVISLIGYWGARQFFIRAFASEDTTVRPFVATETEYSVSNGQEKIMDTVVISRRRDGATSKIETFLDPHGSVKLTARRVELPDGWVGMILDTIRAKSTGVRPAVVLAASKNALLNPPSQCLWNDETMDDEGTLLGQRAFHIIQQGGPNSLRRVTTWRLPDFSCASVGGILEKKADTSSEWHVVSKKVLTAFMPADPDPRTFTGWDGYQEMKPSGIRQELSKANGIATDSCPKCAAGDAKGDQVYADWNKKQE